MKEQFTKGPWKAGRRKGRPWHIDSWQGRVAYIFGTAMKGTKEQQKANARLIAAAPEMFEALKQVIDVIKSEESDELTHPQLSILAKIGRMVNKIERGQTDEP